MDPRLLLPPENPLAYPAPFWFIELFKVLGFALHVLPMNLWYAGAAIAAVAGVLGKGNTKIMGFHIARALPFALAFGINFGIIPLLFIQTAYYQFFYPATILMAWPWFSVFWLVMIAYSSVYLYRMATLGSGPVKIGMAASWIAAGIFIIIGFLFANAFSLISRPEGWWGIFSKSNIAGAPTGVALNFGDHTLIPRWLFMFGIALTTTAVYIMIDAAFLSDREADDYKSYAAKFSFKLYTAGLIWFAIFGSWYIFGTKSGTFQLALTNPVMRFIFPLTMLSPGLPWLLIFFQREWPVRRFAVLAGVAQFGVVALNAISRQWVQNTELAPYANLAARPVNVQTGALIVFLAAFAFGIALSAWMLRKVIEANRAGGMLTEEHQRV